MGRLYDLVLADNPVKTNEDRHALNIFLSRLLFCYFAEDTGIYEQDQFTNGVASHTDTDGSDLQEYIEKVFHVLSTTKRKGMPKYLAKFPYMNGGLFAEEYPVPKFSRKSRQIIIECGSLNWRAINPDIFGSMIQAVVHDDDRSNLGMHYTSVANIMKVIEPLFLNDLRVQLEAAGKSKKKLEKFLNRLYHLRIFDPACGSGNFLVIAFKELCKLEMEAFKKLHGKQKTFRFESKIRLGQFYGIELDDFAHETAKLSLWLAEHQMNLAFKDVFGECRPTLPLDDAGNIFCGNATRMKWDIICPADSEHEVYIIGNPPYLGFSERDSEQKADMKHVFAKLGNVKRLDYVACWVKIAADFISNNSKCRFALVMTSSICQGEQVSLIWPYVFQQGHEILFAHQPFKWSNNAKHNAGVSCVIVGVGTRLSADKFIFADGVRRKVREISPYLVEGAATIMAQRKDSVAGLPEMAIGSTSIDGGNLVLSPDERRALIQKSPDAERFVRPFVGGGDFLKGIQRYCLWIEDNEVQQAMSIPFIADRIEQCRTFRLSGGRDAKKGATVPHRFFYRKYKDGEAIVFPMTSSERREYIPVGYVSAGTVPNHGVFVVYDSDPFVFGILSSRMHMVWLQVFSGRLESRIRYSVNLVYNTFPFPKVSSKQRELIVDSVFRILDEREQYPEMTLAELYTPETMPPSLKQVHQENDQIVDRCFRATAFKSDSSRLEALFKQYAKMTSSDLHF